MDAVSKTNAPHYIWGEACDGWRLEDFAERSIIHERMPGGTAETRHYHEKASQFFFMLAGRAVIEIDGREVGMGPQEGVTVEPGLWHRIRNDSAEAAEFLVISTPSTRGDRIEKT
jgi:mannose-6-phosphate isomerase-like protein (cupin superfamily)